MQAPKQHAHSGSGATVYGALLEFGDVLQETDVYDSANGRWECGHMRGAQVIDHGGVGFTWVRPVQP